MVCDAAHGPGDAFWAACLRDDPLELADALEGRMRWELFRLQYDMSGSRYFAQTLIDRAGLVNPAGCHLLFRASEFKSFTIQLSQLFGVKLFYLLLVRAAHALQRLHLEDGQIDDLSDGGSANAITIDALADLLLDVLPPNVVFALHNQEFDDSCSGLPIPLCCCFAFFMLFHIAWMYAWR